MGKIKRGKKTTRINTTLSAYFLEKALFFYIFHKRGDQWLKTLKSLGYYAIVLGVILSILYVLKTVILQTLGILLIGVFLAMGCYFLGYLLLGVFSLILITGSVISVIGLLVYYLF